MLFKTRFEEIKTKPVLENKINSNIDHRQSPVFLFYFKVPPRGLIWNAVNDMEVNKRLLDGLSPNSLKKHKRQLKEKLIQKQIAFLSQKKSSSHRTATANPRHGQVYVTVNVAVNSNNSNKSNKADKLVPLNKAKCEICQEIFTKQGITKHTNSCRKKQKENLKK